jgi:hypothetical protein
MDHVNNVPCPLYVRAGSDTERVTPRTGTDSVRTSRLTCSFRVTAPSAAFARLNDGLDEAIVRIITTRPGLEPVVQAMTALTPSLIREAKQAGPDGR